jgi:filamentous hemagglutinin
MKRQARGSRQVRVTRPAGSRPLPMRLTCSFIALASVGVVGMASHAAFAAGPLTKGTVPTNANYLGGIGIGSISTTNTATGRWTTIEQTQRAAIASFNKFNIAAGSGVTIGQVDSGYRMLVQIFDNDPTLIQGALQAKGQVFLLNRNGILFGAGAQVNVGAMFASSLNIKDQDFLDGFDVSATGTSANKFTKFIPFTDPVTGKPLASGPIQVASGASLNALPGGAIVLIAPQIENAGIITAPDGQVILAAGQTAYLWQRNTENNNDAKASALRGLMVEITAADGDVNLTSMVRNLGEISADRGNVSIAALAINQEGRISAGSSVIRNGSIWLTARSVADPGTATTLSDSDVSRTTKALGTVTFGKDSFTGTPLLNDEGRLSESASYSSFDVTAANGTTYKRDFRSWIHVVGNKIDNRGQIVAPGGTIDLLAQGAGGRVLLESGSKVSAAGNWVDRAMSDNLLTLKRVTSNDLQDAPVQKAGPLLGESVTVDVRQGSPLFDVSKYTANLQRTVQEKATVGGAITIEARQGDVISAAGSVIDVSGGGFRYAGGSYTTTKLIGADGKLYDIATASPQRNYIGTTDGISRVYQKAGPTGFNQTRTWATRYKSTPTTETAYVEGASAGSLTVVAPNIVRQGDWYGGVTLGRYQVNQADVSRVARAATLTIGDFGGLSGTSSTLVNKITFDQAPALPRSFGINDVLPTTLTDSVILSPDQFGYTAPQGETYAYTGFGTLNLYADQSITVPAGVEVKLAPGAAFNAATKTGGGQRIVLEGARDGLAAGAISAPAGSVSLTSSNVILGAGQFAVDGSPLAAGARIDASGMVYAESRDAQGLPAAGGFTARAGNSLTEYLTNNIAALVADMAGGKGRPAGAVAAPRFAINASSAGIKIDGTNVAVGDGTTLSAMGGFVVGADNTITGGKGGSIALPFTPSAAGGSPDDRRETDDQCQVLGARGRLRDGTILPCYRFRHEGLAGRARILPQGRLQ